jgi:hypothetical protein
MPPTARVNIKEIDFWSVSTVTTPVKQCSANGKANELLMRHTYPENMDSS